MQGSQRRKARPALALLAALLVVGSLGIAGITSASDATPAASPVSAQGQPWWQEAVCYEIFVRSFVDSDGDGIGDLTGLTSRLDYLNDGDPTTSTDLGVNCVWLMPVAEATSYHGYDTIDYTRIEQDYGTNEDFKGFVAGANERGVRVIVDLVLNHVSVEHAWFQEALADPSSPYREYFVFAEDDPGYPGSFGQDVWFPTPSGDAFYYATFGEGLPDLNYRNPAVTEAAYEITRFWLDDMGVDGFRLDAIKHLIEDGRVQENTPETHAWLMDFGAFVASVKPDAYTIGEIFNASAFTLGDYFPDQLTAYFHFEFGPQIMQAAIAANAGTLPTTVRNTVSQLPDQRWGLFLTNHDQTRAMIPLNGSIPKAKLAATALLTLPGLPFLYYGEEIGMRGLKPDPRLRTPMQWTADASGFTSGEPWEPFQDDLATVNVAAQESDPESLLNHYRAVVQLHGAHPALSRGHYVGLEAPTSVLAFLRRSEDETVLVVLNFGTKPLTGAELGLDGSDLALGSYELVPLLGDLDAQPMTIGQDGAILAYQGLPELAATTGYVFQVVPAPD